MLVRSASLSRISKTLAMTAALCIAASSTVLGAGGVTGILRGSVVDSKTNAPVAGAAVLVSAESG